MASLFRFSLILALAAAGVCRAQSVWESVYFYDEDESALTLLDVAALAPDRAIALGQLSDGGRTRTVLIETADAGRTWKLRRVSPDGLSLFFLNASDGWLVAADGLHRTADGGASWKQIYKSKMLLRSRFLDEKRGFAVGVNKTAVETRDGGLTWTPISAAAEQKVQAERTAFTWLEFQGDTGFISGFHKPLRRSQMMPDWVDPEQAERRRQLPSLSITLQTLDRGATWKASLASLFGQISRFRTGAGGRAVSVVEFEPQFEWPSEVFEIDLATGKAERIYRERDRHVTDAMYLPDGRLILAAVVTPGRMHHLPVPGPVRILEREGSAWKELEVDYRASAGRVSFAHRPGGEPWVYTDTGMILGTRRAR